MFGIVNEQKLLPDGKDHYLAPFSEKNDYRPALPRAMTDAGAQPLNGQNRDRIGDRGHIAPLEVS
jgi:hypothetical protein